MMVRFLRRLGLALLMLSNSSAGAAWQDEYVKANPEEGRVRGLIVAGGSLLIFGVLCCVIAVALNYPQVRSWFWPTTPGLVEVSEIRQARAGGIPVQVSYSYRVNGREYSSSRRSIVDQSFYDIRFAIEEADRYPVGQVVTVSYNRRDPGLAILEPGYDLMADWLFVAGLCLSIVGIGFLLLQLARSISHPSGDELFRSPERVP
ncbi:MAG: DUF3592 domain-containing protein [Phycisphaerales bacterium]